MQERRMEKGATRIGRVRIATFSVSCYAKNLLIGPRGTQPTRRSPPGETMRGTPAWPVLCQADSHSWATWRLAALVASILSDEPPACLASCPSTSGSETSLPSHQKDRKSVV